MTTSNVSTAVKIVVSMVVVAALVATHFSSSKVRDMWRDVHGVNTYNRLGSLEATENVHLEIVMLHAASG